MTFRLSALVFAGISFCAQALSAQEAGGAPDLEYPHYDTPSDIPAHVFAKDAGISSARMAPDGEHFFVIMPNLDKINIRVYTTSDTDGESHYFDSVDRDNFGGAFWASNDRLIVQVENWLLDKRWRWYRLVRLIAVDKNGQNVEPLYRTEIHRSEAYIEDLIVDRLPNEPNHILIAASEDGKSPPGVYKLDIYTGETELVLEGRKNIRSWMSDHDGDIRLGIGSDDDEMVMIGRAKGATEWTDLHNNELFEDGRFFPLNFDFDGQSMFVRSAMANGRFAVYKFDLTTGALSDKLFEHAAVDASGIELSEASRKLLAVTYVEDKLERQFFDEHYEKLHKSIDRALPGRSNYVLDKTPDDRFLLIYSVSDQYPGAIYQMDTQDKRMHVLEELNAEINPMMMSATVRRNYFARDGLEIPAYLTIPRGADGKDLPVVVMPHGGPSARTEIEYDRMVQFIASRGYAVFQPNYRGSTGYSWEYQTLGYGEWGAAMQQDLEDAADFLVDEGIAKEGSICIMGNSAYGSYAALVGVMTSPERFNCAIAISPITDLPGYVKARKSDYGKRAAWRVSGDRGSKEIKAVSPVHLVKDLNKPVLLFYGDKDRVVDKKTFETFTKALTKGKKKFELIESEEDGNGLSLPKTRTKFYRKLESFLQENLGEGWKPAPAPAPDAAKPTEASAAGGE